MNILIIVKICEGNRMEYTIVHHYPTSEEDFLKHQAELIADVLLQELEPNEIESIKNLYTTEMKGQ